MAAVGSWVGSLLLLAGSGEPSGVGFLARAAEGGTASQRQGCARDDHPRSPHGTLSEGPRL